MSVIGFWVMSGDTVQTTDAASSAVVRAALARLCPDHQPTVSATLQAHVMLCAITLEEMPSLRKQVVCLRPQELGLPNGNPVL